jgi:hypothetical protein
MILKLSDLQRSLDQSLETTHGQSRIFVIVARYCAKAGKQAHPVLESRLTISLGRRFLFLPIPFTVSSFTHKPVGVMVELYILDGFITYSRDGIGYKGPMDQDEFMGKWT